MNAVDTNVLTYAIDQREPEKSRIAQALLDRLINEWPETGLPWQVAGEYLRYLRSEEARGRLLAGSTRFLMETTRTSFSLSLPRPQVLDVALVLAARYSLSHRDGMLVAACLVSGVDTHYTEDMGAPRAVDQLALVNPFA